jgi:hypothetical protein
MLAVVTGMVALGERGDPTVEVALVAGGLVVIGLLAPRRRRDREAFRGLPIDRQIMGAALFVGVIVGFSQAVLLMATAIPALSGRGAEEAQGVGLRDRASPVASTAAPWRRRQPVSR